jgi:hypothetical protein
MCFMMFQLIVAVRAMKVAKKLTTRISDRPNRFPFRNAGLSDHTVTALLNGGIDAPNRLLAITPADIAVIPGIGRTSLDQILRYRARQQEIPSIAVEEHQPSCFAFEEEKGGGWKGGA